VSYLRLSFALALTILAFAVNSSALRAADDADPLVPYDRLMTSLLEKWKIPGGSIAVTKDGRLVFARGYGLADVAAKKPVAADSLFRVASVSKPITAVAVMRLAEQGKINLDEPALAAVGPLEPPPDAKVDPRLAKITVRQLLQHTGGWDRDKSFDAMFIPEKAARVVGAPSPADATTVMRYMMSVPLDFDPGARYAYSNLGYAILGRLIERRTSLPYGEAVQQLVLRPAGATRMKLGRTLKEFRPPEEVCYYHFKEKELADPVFPYVKDKVAWPDGGFYLEAMDAHGGWIASAVDLVKFAAAVEGRGRDALLRSESIAAMTAPPEPNVWKGKDSHYGFGWNVRRDGQDANWWHTGSLPGTMALLVRAHNGMSWAVLLNTRPEKAGGLQRELDAGCWKAAAEVTEWPKADLFPQYP
jgi:N-acyl-D-amino-acid deacylase